MQEGHDFLKGFLRLVLTRYILERLSRLGFNIDLGIALTKAHHIAAAQFRAQKPHDQLTNAHKEQEGENPVVEKFGQRRILPRDNLGKLHISLDQTIDKFWILNAARDKDFIFTILVAQKGDAVLIDFYFGSLAFINHLQEVGISNFLDARFKEHGRNDRIDDENDEDGRKVIIKDTFGMILMRRIIHSDHLLILKK